MNVACTYLFSPCLCLVPAKARRGCQNYVEPELQTDVSCHEGTGSQTWILCKDSKYLQSLSLISSPHINTVLNLQFCCKISWQRVNSALYATDTCAYIKKFLCVCAYVTMCLCMCVYVIVCLCIYIHDNPCGDQRTSFEIQFSHCGCRPKVQIQVVRLMGQHLHSELSYQSL